MKTRRILHRQNCALIPAPICCASIFLAALLASPSLASADPPPATLPTASVDLTHSWSLLQIGDTQGAIEEDATNPLTSQPHLLRITVTKTGIPGGGRVGAISGILIPVTQDQWFDITFSGRPQRASIGLVFSLENAAGDILARTTLPEIGRPGRRGPATAPTTPSEPQKYHVALHARAADPAAHLVITPIEPTTVWLGDLTLTPRNPAP